MLKSSHPVNIEQEAATALRDALAAVPGIEDLVVDVANRSVDRGVDLICRLTFQGRSQGLVAAVKVGGQPRQVQSSLFDLKRHAEQNEAHLVPVFIAPYLSEEARALCTAHGVGYLDLHGNARIAFPGFFLSRTMAGKPAAERRELRSLFKPKSAAVLRRLLREPPRRWRVAELASETLVSLGHVSNVRTSLLDRGWAELSDGGMYLSRPNDLLDAWREAYAPPPQPSFTYYTTLHGSSLDDVLRKHATERSPDGAAILSAFSAARWLAPYGRTSTHTFYADQRGMDRLCEILGLTHADKGANVEVTVVDDVDLFRDAIEPAPGVRCTSAVQTYLDLSATGERGQEAAEHLRQEMLQWKE